MSSKTINLTRVCRICEGKFNLQLLINKQNQGISKKLSSFAQIDVHTNDGKPQYICSSCVENLEFSSNFRLLCQLSDKKWCKLLIDKNRASKSENYEEDTDIKEEPRGPSQKSTDVKIEDYTEQDYTEMDYEVIDNEIVDERMEFNSLKSQHDSVKIEQEDDDTDNKDEFHKWETEFEVESGLKASENEDAFLLFIRKRVDMIEEKFEQLGKEMQQSAETIAKLTIKSRVRNGKPVKVEKTCPVCDKTFENAQTLKEHTKENICGGIACEICGNLFRTGFLMLRHRAEYHPAAEKPYACQQCAAKFADAGLYEEHITYPHATNPEVEMNLYFCTFGGGCRKRSATEVGVSRHMLYNHIMEKKHQCQHCDKSYTQLNYLKEHERVHTGEKPFCCEICGKSFSRNLYLQEHLRRHRNLPARTRKPQPKRDWVCDICLKILSSKKACLNHKLIHTGERPFKCNFCEKSFSDVKTRNDHLRMHTGERPYACPYCEKTFAQSSMFAAHKRRHTGEPPKPKPISRFLEPENIGTIDTIIVTSECSL